MGPSAPADGAAWSRLPGGRGRMAGPCIDLARPSAGGGGLGEGSRPASRLECRLDEPLPGLLGLLLARNHSISAIRVAIAGGRRPAAGPAICRRGAAHRRSGRPRKHRGSGDFRVQPDAAAHRQPGATHRRTVAGRGMAERKPYRWFAPCARARAARDASIWRLLPPILAEGERRARCDNGRRRCRHSDRITAQRHAGLRQFESRTGAGARGRQDSKTLSLDEVRRRPWMKAALDDMLPRSETPAAHLLPRPADPGSLGPEPPDIAEG